MLIFHRPNTTACKRQPRTYVLILDTQRSGLVWVSIKIIIAGRGAFLSSRREPVQFSGPAATASYRLAYTPPHFVFACLNAIAMDWLASRIKVTFAIEKQSIDSRAAAAVPFSAPNQLERCSRRSRIDLEDKLAERPNVIMHAIRNRSKND